MVSCIPDVCLTDVTVASSKEPDSNLSSLGKEVTSFVLLALVCRGYYSGVGLVRYKQLQSADRAVWLVISRTNLLLL
jgi:hypothetical protein